MKSQLLPKSKVGIGAVVFSLLFVVIMALELLASNNSFALRLPLPTPAIAVLGVIGLVLSLIAVFKYKDKALFTLLSIPIGTIIVVWFAAEFIATL
jgi:hypothetical protein